MESYNNICNNYKNLINDILNVYQSNYYNNSELKLRKIRSIIDFYIRKEDSNVK